MAFLKPYYTAGLWLCRHIDLDDFEMSSGAELHEHCKTWRNEASRPDHWKVVYVDGWFARLSADGYLDCTDWIGPFETEAAARQGVKDEFQVDPDTGDVTDE